MEGEIKREKERAAIKEDLLRISKSEKKMLATEVKRLQKKIRNIFIVIIACAIMFLIRQFEDNGDVFNRKMALDGH